MPWMNKALSPDERADLVLGQMTLDEKIQMVHGAGWGVLRAGAPIPARSNFGAGFMAGIDRLGIPDINLADSAVGIRMAAYQGRYATLLPSTLGAASSWDPDSAFLYGSVIGRELRALGLQHVHRRRREHHPRTPQRPQLRVRRRRSHPRRNHDRQSRKRRPVAACHERHQALRAQRSGDRTHRRQRSARQKSHARVRPARLRDRHRHRRSLRRHVLLQPRRRQLRLRERLPAQPGPEEGLQVQGLGRSPTGARPTAPSKPRSTASIRRCPATTTTSTRR